MRADTLALLVESHTRSVAEVIGVAGCVAHPQEGRVNSMHVRAWLGVRTLALLWTNSRNTEQPLQLVRRVGASTFDDGLLQW